MPTDSGRDGERTTVATVGFLLLPILCCTLPLLITIGTLTTIGAWLGNPWVIAAAVVVPLLGLLAWRRYRQPPSATGSTDSGAAPPESPIRDTPGRRGADPQ